MQPDEPGGMSVTSYAATVTPLGAPVFAHAYPAEVERTPPTTETNPERKCNNRP